MCRWTRWRHRVNQFLTSNKRASTERLRNCVEVNDIPRRFNEIVSWKIAMHRTGRKNWRYFSHIASRYVTEIILRYAGKPQLNRSESCIIQRPMLIYYPHISNSDINSIMLKDPLDKISCLFSILYDKKKSIFIL